MANFCRESTTMPDHLLRTKRNKEKISVKMVLMRASNGLPTHIPRSLTGREARKLSFQTVPNLDSDQLLPRRRESTSVRLVWTRMFMTS